MLRLPFLRHLASNWIYSSKFDQLSNQAKGKLILTPTALNIHDVTLRMHQHMFLSDIILCEDYRHTNNLLHSLKNKLTYIEDSPIKSDIIISNIGDSSNASEQLIELSEHLKHNEQMYLINKKALDSQEMVRQQEEIKKYNRRVQIKKDLQEFKTSRGYGYIIDLRQELPDLMDYLHQGLNVIYIHPQGGRYLKWFLKVAEQNKYPYEVLPGPSQLISTLAASGFPADRFGINYFFADLPNNKIKQIFLTRKKQCFTVCLYEQLAHLQHILSNVEKVYGANQMVFVRIEGTREEMKKEVGEMRELIRGKNLIGAKENKCVIVVSPYAIEYNSEFKQIEFEKHYLNQLIHNEQTTLYEVQKLTKKLSALKEEKKYEIDSIKAAKYLYDSIPNESDTLDVIKSLLRIGSDDAERILLEAKKLPNDILKLEKR